MLTYPLFPESSFSLLPVVPRKEIPHLLSSETWQVPCVVSACVCVSMSLCVCERERGRTVNKYLLSICCESWPWPCLVLKIQQWISKGKSNNRHETLKNNKQWILTICRFHICDLPAPWNVFAALSRYSAATVILGRALGGENLNSPMHESPAGFHHNDLCHLGSVQTLKCPFWGLLRAMFLYIFVLFVGGFTV